MVAGWEPQLAPMRCTYWEEGAMLQENLAVLHYDGESSERGVLF